MTLSVLLSAVSTLSPELLFFFCQRLSPAIQPLFVFVPRSFDVLDDSPWCVNNVYTVRKEFSIEVFEIWSCNNF